MDRPSYPQPSNHKLDVLTNTPLQLHTFQERIHTTKIGIMAMKYPLATRFKMTNKEYIFTKTFIAIFFFKKECSSVQCI